MSNYTLNCIHYEVCRRATCNTKCQYFEERPQGKWKKMGEDYYNWISHFVIKCSICGYVKDTPYENFPNFCENCGADMRKEAEDERL